jgi:hypothetical protein
MSFYLGTSLPFHWSQLPDKLQGLIEKVNRPILSQRQRDGERERFGGGPVKNKNVFFA